MSYLDKIAELDKVGTFKAGEVSRVSVAHDDWCPALRGGVCRCEPDITTATKPNRAARRAAQKKGR